MRRDLLQLRRLPGAPPAALPQRVHLLAPCGRHRAPRRRSADLPLLLSFAHRLARDAARDRHRLRPREPLGRPAPRLAIRSARAAGAFPAPGPRRSEEHTSELQSLAYLVCRLLLEKKKKKKRKSYRCTVVSMAPR